MDNTNIELIKTEFETRMSDKNRRERLKKDVERTWKRRSRPERSSESEGGKT